MKWLWLIECASIKVRTYPRIIIRIVSWMRALCLICRGLSRIIELLLILLIFIYLSLLVCNYFVQMSNLILQSFYNAFKTKYFLFLVIKSLSWPGCAIKIIWILNSYNILIIFCLWFIRLLFDFKKLLLLKSILTEAVTRPINGWAIRMICGLILILLRNSYLIFHLVWNHI